MARMDITDARHRVKSDSTPSQRITLKAVPAGDVLGGVADKPIMAQPLIKSHPLVFTT
jgi:hypothetical protein